MATTMFTQSSRWHFHDCHAFPKKLNRPPTPNGRHDLGVIIWLMPPNLPGTRQNRPKPRNAPASAPYIGLFADRSELISSAARKST